MPEFSEPKIIHPITPPEDYVSDWVGLLNCRTHSEVFTLAAQWGADEELNWCCAHLNQCHFLPNELRINLIDYLLKTRR